MFLPPAAPLPGPLSKVFLEAGLAAGRTLASLGLPFSRTAVQHILQSGDSLRLQFPREDLGFRYTEGGAVAAPSYWGVTEEGHRMLWANSNSSSSSSSTISSSSSSSRGSERGSSYVPSSAAGLRLPHVPLMMMRGDQDEEQHQVRGINRGGGMDGTARAGGHCWGRRGEEERVWRGGERWNEHRWGGGGGRAVGGGQDRA